MKSENINRVNTLLNLIKYAESELMEINHEIFLTVYKNRPKKETSDIYLRIEGKIKKDLVDSLNSDTKSKIEKFKAELKSLGVEVWLN